MTEQQPQRVSVGLIFTLIKKYRHVELSVDQSFIYGCPCILFTCLPTQLSTGFWGIWALLCGMISDTMIMLAFLTYCMILLATLWNIHFVVIFSSHFELMLKLFLQSLTCTNTDEIKAKSVIFYCNPQHLGVTFFFF